MSKPTPTRVLLRHTLALTGKRVFVALLALMVITSVVSITRTNPPIVKAAAPTTLNFQARLMTSSGTLVPDGTYNIDFKLYNHATNGAQAQGTCSSVCLWEETRTGANKVEVKNGYLSAYLGDVTALPSNIWNQQLWLTMNIGGTGAASWDGEMSPRIRLTSVPFAFRATVADSAEALSKNTGTNTGTVNFANMTADRTFILPDTGLATTASPGTICVFNGAVSNCPAATGSAYYIQNTSGSGTPQASANFNIQATDSGVNGTVVGILRGAVNGQTVDMLQFQNPAGTVLAAVTAGGNLQVASYLDTRTAGALSLGNTNATAINLQQNTTIAATKSLTVTSGATSLTGLAAGSSTALSVTTGATTNVGLLVTGAASQTADLLQVKADGVTTPLLSVSASGQSVFQNSTDSGSAFVIRNQAADNVLSAGTTSLFTNLIADPSFEMGVSGWAAKGGAGAPAQSTAQELYGANSLSFTTTAANQGASYNVTLSPSTQYTFTAFVRISTGTVTSFVMGRQDVSGTNVNCGAQTATNSGWYRLNCTFTTGATITAPSSVYIMQNDAVARTIYLDGVSLVSGVNQTGMQPATGTLQVSSLITSPLALRSVENTNYAFNIANASGTSVFTIDTVNSALTLSGTASSTAAGTGFSATSTTTGSSFNAGGTGTSTGTGFAFNATSNSFSTGKALSVTGAASGITADFSGAYLHVAPTRTLTAAATRTDSGQFLNLVRSNTVNNAGATYNITGALANLQSTCTQTAGTCNDSSNILNLNQQYTASTGAVLNLTGAGTGNLAVLDATNASANGMSIDVQSSSSSQYVFKTTSNNGATTSFQVNGDGSIAAGVSGTNFTVNGALVVNENVTINGNTSLGNTVTDTTDITGSLATKRGADYTTAGSANNVDFGGASLVRLDTSGAAQTITGIAGGRDGFMLTLVNADASANVTLSNNSGSSLAANRITTGTGADLILPAGASTTLIYDSGASLWRVVGGVATTGGGANQSLSNLSSVAINTSLLTGADNTIDLGSAAFSWRSLYADTSVLTPTVDTASAGILSLGTTNATAINLNQNTTVATGKNLTVAAGATNLTGASAGSGTALSVNTGATTNVGIVVQGVASQSAALFQALNNSGSVLFRIDAAGVAGSGDTTAASTNSNNTTLKSGNVSGATSNSGTLTLQSGNSTTSGNTGAVTLTSGNATSGNSGNVTIDSGTASGTTGTVNLGTANASAVNIGRTGYNTIINGALGLGTASPQSSSAMTLANSKWISAVDSAGTGYVNMFQLNANNEIQVGAALNIDGGIVMPTDAGQITFSDLPISSSSTAGTKHSYTMRVGTTNALTVYGEADGSGNAQNIRVAIGSSINPAYTLDVGGTLGVSGTSNLVGNVTVGNGTTGSLQIGDSTITKTSGSWFQFGSGINATTTINSNTGINTGASTGTQRIDASGNLVNIGNLTATAGINISSTGAGNDVTLTAVDQIILNSGGTIELQDNTNVTGTLGVSALTTLSGGLTITNGGNVAFQRNTTDISTTGTLNDLNIGTGALFRFTGASAQTVTSIANPSDGRIITLVNAAAQALTINNDAGGTAANRIITGIGSNLSVPAGATVQLTYDSAASRWRVVGGSAVTGGGANQSLSNLSSVAINTSLLTGADNTIDLGSAAFSWRSLYADTSVLTPTVDTAAAGTLSLGTTNATAITLGKAGITTTNAGALTVTQAFTASSTAQFNGSVTVAANQYLRLTGGTTANRPGSPTEGMIYYDTDTKQLLTYANGKWQGDRSTATKIVAASNSSQAIKDSADYIADGTGDQAEINAALTAAAGGSVYLAEGTYVTSDPILVPNNTTLAGAGRGTLIQFANIAGQTKNMIENSDTTTGTGVVIRDLRLDGNRSVNTSGTMHGIFLSGIGGGGSSTARQGFVVNSVAVYDFRTDGIRLDGVRFGSVTNSVVQNSGAEGINVQNSGTATRIHVTGNILQANSSNGITIGASIQVIVSGNNISQNGVHGINLSSGHSNTISDNSLYDNGGANAYNGIHLLSSDSNLITGNRIIDTAGTGYAISVSNAASDTNYLADNFYSGTGATTINDAGTGTIYGGQLDGSNNYVIQPAGSISLMKDTNVTGNLTVSGDGTFNGGDMTVSTVTATDDQVKVSITAGGAARFLGTITNADLTAARTWTLPDESGTFCMQGSTNCGFATGSGDADYIQNQNASQQATSNFWISGTARSDTSVLTPLLDTASAVALNIGTTNATQINLNKNVVVAANQYLRLTGGTTANRPGSPTEGMIYYDTDTKQLLTYANGKWQGDRSTATKIVAASNSSQAIKDSADYIADGTNDEVEINAALTAAAGGKVYLAEGTFTTLDTISIPNNTTLAGSGNNTLIQFGNLGGASKNMITNTTTGGSGLAVVVRDLRIDGDKATNAAGTVNGIYFSGVGSGSGDTATEGVTVTNVRAWNFIVSGIYITGTDHSTITNNYVQNNGSNGITVEVVGRSVVSGNLTQGNGAAGINASAAAQSTITSNVSIENGTHGIALRGTANLNVVSNNSIREYGSHGIFVTNSDNNLITSNRISDTGGSGYAINISDNTSDTNYLADNTFSGTGATSIQDLGTNTMYGGQSNGTSYLIQPVDDFAITGNAASTISTTAGNLTLQAGSGTVTLGSSTALTATGALSISSGGVNALSLDAGGAAAINIGGTNATSIVLGRAGGGTVRVGQNGGTVQIDGTNFDVSTLGVVTLAGGQTTDITTAGATSLTVDTGGAAAISIGATNATSLTLGRSAITTVNGGNFQFAQGANRTLNVAANTTANAAGYNLTISAGAANGSTTGNTGGNLVLQGGAAAGSGNNNGGSITIAGGAGTGTGTQGLVNLSTTAFTSASVQTFAGSGAVTAGNVDLYSTLPITASTTSVVVTVPDPVQATIGRVLYIAARSGSNDFTLRLNSTRTPIDIAMKANSTATLIWNGTDWTAAGASSSTDLQSAYNNTLTSAGGAEIVLNPTGGAADGFTIRNNGTTPISGGLLEVQSSIGTNLFSVNNQGTELASNGGAETSASFNTDWTAVGSAARSRTTTAGQFVTGLAGASVTTTAAANDGIRNNLTANPVVSTTYQVSFTAKLSAGTFSTLQVMYSRDGGTDLEPCTSYSTQTLSTSVWTKITCTITTDSTTATNPDLIIRQSDATVRTFYIDNLSFMRNDSTTQPSNVQIGGGINGGPITLFTLDRSTAPPVANGNTTYYGSMYYDTTSGRIQCYEADGWGACGSAPDNIITLTPEYAGAVLNGSGVGTMTADFCGNGGGLSVNTSFCASGEARSYYKWTSPQATLQTYSIYVNYKLPSTFKGFLDANTIKLTAYRDDASDANALVSMDVYRKNVSGGTITQCGSSTNITQSSNSWEQRSETGDETGCSFTAGDYVIFKINMSARNNKNVYVENLDFTFSNT